MYGWMMSEGLALLQILILIMFIVDRFYLRWHVKRLAMMALADRAAAIEEVRLRADALEKRTAEIADHVKQETLDRAEESVRHIETKVDEVLHRFDAIGAPQQHEVKLVVDTDNLEATQRLVESVLQKQPDQS